MRREVQNAGNLQSLGIPKSLVLSCLHFYKYYSKKTEFKHRGLQGTAADKYARPRCARRIDGKSPPEVSAVWQTDGGASVQRWHGADSRSSVFTDADGANMLRRTCNIFWHCLEPAALLNPLPSHPSWPSFIANLLQSSFQTAVPVSDFYFFFLPHSFLPFGVCLSAGFANMPERRCRFLPKHLQVLMVLK